MFCSSCVHYTELLLSSFCIIPSGNASRKSFVVLLLFRKNRILLLKIMDTVSENTGDPVTICLAIPRNHQYMYKNEFYSMSGNNFLH